MSLVGRERAMDSTTRVEGVKRGLYFVVWWSCLVFGFTIFSFFILFLVGLVVVVSEEVSISHRVSVPSRCKIVWSSVDLRSSKVCGIGLLNYKAKHAFYPFDSDKFRCRYDYYWASIFKVEYRDHLFGQTRLALAEAPNEALPLDCRPSFVVAWLTKDNFKVNETYDCWYTSGISKIKLYRDDFFGCRATDLSVMEIVTQYSILFTNTLRSWFTPKDGPKYWRRETLAGVVSGFSTSLITVSAARIFQHIRSKFPQACSAGKFAQNVNMDRMRRTCFLVVYLSVVGWLATKYMKLLNLPRIFRM